MDSVSYRAYGKINLSLDVTGVREDGYHLVRMIMQTVDVCDELVFRKDPSGQVGVTVSENSAEPDAALLPPGADNLVCRAIGAAREAFGIREGVRVTLTKNIPMAAGMAGGSVDAAAALQAMRDLFDPGVSDKQLAALALPLGADIPYCLTGGTALAEGIGEVLTPLPGMPECGIVLVKPREGVSTGTVYRMLNARPDASRPDPEAMLSAIRGGDLSGICGCCGNVLESVTSEMLPVIGAVRERLMDEGALTAHMTGSGPTVFGIFRDRAAAERAAERLTRGKLPEGSRVIAAGPADRSLRRLD